MGWSSWYALGPDVDQARVEASYLKLVNKSVVAGSNRSLQDVGYVFANVDDGWQACHSGVDGSFHSAAGEPLVNTTKFPNISAMTAKAHSLGLSPGFYFNNYICSEGMPRGGIGGKTYMRNMNGTVDFLARNRFSYVKVDSGSVYNDMQLWHDLINATGQPITIENCHQGHLTPNSTWCPFDLFRTSGDAHVVGLDVELLATAADLQFSRPGCWAYPDTLDAGSAAAVRSQLGAFAVMSSPLLLSFDILDDAKLLPVWDILTNEEVIRVNQQWAGAPGRLLRRWSQHSPSEPLYPWAEACTGSEVQRGWALDGLGRLTRDGLCLGPGEPLPLGPCATALRWRALGGRLFEERPAPALLEVPQRGALRLAPCSASLAQQWHISPNTGPREVRGEQGGCWEITGCVVADGSEVGVNFGCKPLPAPGWSDRCLANGAWSVNDNGTITSLMDGKCLEVDPGDKVTVTVNTCSLRRPTQQWVLEGTSVRSLAVPGHCVDSGIPPPPPNTTGRCASLQVTNDAGGAGAWGGLLGPALLLAPRQQCGVDTAPPQMQQLSVDEGRLRAGSLCAAARHGVPTPFGPLQLWAKPQPGGAVAVALLNRAGAESEVLLELRSLGLEGKRAHVRDLWAHQDLPLAQENLTVRVPGGDSRLLLLTPEQTTVSVRV